MRHLRTPAKNSPHLELNTRWWVWLLHLLAYPYVLFMYFYDRSLGDEGDPDQRRKVWVALDIMLTAGMGIYFCLCHYLEE